MQNHALLIVSFSFVAVCLILPIWYTVWRGDWRRGILLNWACLVGWFILASLAGAAFGGNSEESPFPDGPSVVGAFFMGWLPSSIICGFAMVVRAILRRFWPWFAAVTQEPGAAEHEGKHDNDEKNEHRSFGCRSNPRRKSDEKVLATDRTDFTDWGV